MRTGLVLVLFLAAQLAQAACDPADGHIVLRIQDFATAYFRDFTVDSGGDRAEFDNGVCVHGSDDSWTVRAVHIGVTGLLADRPVRLHASDATLDLPNWQISADSLTSDGEEFLVQGGAFRGDGFSGTVAVLSFDITTGLLEGSDLQAEGPGFRIRGERASFSDDAVRIRNVAVTTCKCPVEPAYVLVGDAALVDLSAAGDSAITVYDGEFRLGRLSFSVAEEFELSGDSISDLNLPVEVEWDPAQPGEAPRGHGLNLLIQPLQLHPQASLEFGLSGLDAGHPLGGHFMFRAETDDAQLQAGFSRRGGPHAEFQVRHQLHEHLQLTLGSNHRHYPAQSYLHEGFLTLTTMFPTQNLGADARVSWGANMTVALSSQLQSGTSVVSPRLRSAVFADWRLPRQPAGQLSLRTDFELSLYSAQRQQYGLRFRPAWRHTIGPVLLTLNHDLRLTDSGSPFTTTLDRLTPINRTVFQARLQDVEVSPGLRFSSTFRFDYNWVRFASGDRRGVEDLLLSGSFDWQTDAGSWQVRPELTLQLAGLFDPRVQPERLAFIEGSLSARQELIELGVSSRFHLGGRHRGLQSLEFHAAYPLEFTDVSLVPFLAVDLGPLLADWPAPVLSGHGLAVNWDSCCGLFGFSYRVHGEEFTTSFSAEFIH